MKCDNCRQRFAVFVLKAVGRAAVMRQRRHLCRQCLAKIAEQECKAKMHVTLEVIE